MLAANIGSRYFLSSTVVCGEAISPFSISFTNPSPTTSVILISNAKALEVSANNSLLRVPLVAKMPILLVLDINAAGLMAGSMPMNAIW